MTEEMKEQAAIALYERFVKTYIENENEESHEVAMKIISEELGFKVPNESFSLAMRMFRDEVFERAHGISYSAFSRMPDGGNFNRLNE